MNKLGINSLKMVARMVKPWKRNSDWDERSADYVDGWNDALKEIDKNYKKYVLPVLEKFNNE